MESQNFFENFSKGIRITLERRWMQISTGNSRGFSIKYHLGARIEALLDVRPPTQTRALRHCLSTCLTRASLQMCMRVSNLAKGHLSA